MLGVGIGGGGGAGLGERGLPIGVEGKHVEDNLDDGHCNPDRHEQSNHLIAPGMGTVQHPHHQVEASQGICWPCVIVHLKLPLGLSPLGSIQLGNALRCNACSHHSCFAGMLSLG